jgi:SulP family sulfate permease
MIGQSVINVGAGGRGRLSTFIAGVFLLVLIVALDDIVRIIPMAALVAVMIMVSIGTFSWRSILDLRRNPWTSSVVMLATVATVLATQDLAEGVLVGVLLSGVFFAGKVARLVEVISVRDQDGDRLTYLVRGQIFFASAESFLAGFDLGDEPKRVVIALTHAQFWDISAVAALDKVVLKLRRNGADVTVLGLNEASATMVDRFGLHDKEVPAGASLPPH